MEKLIIKISMVESENSLRGKSNNRNYHGEFRGLAPWKNSLSRFPWWNLEIFSMEKVIIEIPMVLVDEWHHGKDKYQHFHGD